MIGPCLCGDTHCPSCGPAQGNWRCPICRAWADDDCEHIEAYCKVCGAIFIDNEDGSGNEVISEMCGAHGHEVDTRLKPKFQAEAEKIAAAEAAAYEFDAREMTEDE